MAWTTQLQAQNPSCLEMRRKRWLKGNKVVEVTEVRARAEQDHSSVHPEVQDITFNR